MSSRTWVKINCDRWFDGTIRKEPIELRAIWTDLLALAGRTGHDGIIRLPGTNIGYSDEQLCSIFNVQMSVWLEAKERLRNHPSGAEENRITINSGNCIEIINWKYYQSEYSRQKSYREKEQQKVTAESYNRKCGEKEREKEILRSKERSKPIVRSTSSKRTTYSDDFRAFWSAYPRAIGKLVAFEAWGKVVKEYPPADLIRSAKEYAAKCEELKTEERFILHPATFLRKDRWKDYCFEEVPSA